MQSPAPALRLPPRTACAAPRAAAPLRATPLAMRRCPAPPPDARPPARCTPPDRPTTGPPATTVADQTTMEKRMRCRLSLPRQATQRRCLAIAKRPISSDSRARLARDQRVLAGIEEIARPLDSNIRGSRITDHLR